MVSDLEELLRDTAPQPTRPLDTGALVHRARRQVLAGRLAAGLGGVAVLVAAVLLVPSVVGIDQELEIAERPSELPTGERSDAEQLWNRTYVSSEVIENGTPRDLVDGTSIELTLQREPPVRDADGGQLVDPDADGFATWQAGCNRSHSQLYLTNGRFEFGGFGHTTLMLCTSDEQDAQDRWVDEFFRSGPAWELRDGRLVLRAGGLTLAFRETPGAGAAPTAGAATSSAAMPLMKVDGWREELQPATVVSVLEIAFDRQTAERAWQDNTPAGLANVAGTPTDPGIYATLEDVDFDTHALAVWSSRQWSDCPGWAADVEGDGSWLEVRRGVAAADGVIEDNPHENCSGHQVPYRMLIAVDRERLPDPGRLPMQDLTGVSVTNYPAELDHTTAERAPDAGTAAEHWPVELIYTFPNATPETELRRRFRGTSWAAWTIESNVTDDGPLPSGQWSSPGGPGFDTSDTWVDDRTQWRGVSAELHPEWRTAVGLVQRVVVPLDQMPGGQDLIASLGLTQDEVEAYATPNVAGCDGPLDLCAPDDANAARGIAHLATGFPLFAEERYDGRDTNVWLIAEHFAFSDDAAPFNEGP
ncbi:META domain-containing protein [Egicoccus halophilus]|uniref:DUF306 domain-containing protein n=1 Tax=Egicoccus halophilus TaxID=1670830 RepID=A0A8J3ET61_9ACTN|nr:META domain-containing protein [Egicoccus halophilus]GGI04967.1 hypothetical protein GCM10011354_11730 [Egicoccus halophilus]